ncbi:MAG: hypothetical protein V2J89_04855 [Halieaceae bacterium]|jgi:hypothetical protein|nr:hypothetical protein [Halieaceae bacterium]
MASRRVASPSLLQLLALVIGLTACGADVPGPDDTAQGQGAANARAHQARALLEDQYAYHVGVFAYLYGYPHVDRYRRARNAELAAGLPAFDPMSGLGFFEALNTLLRDQPDLLGRPAFIADLNAIGVGPADTFDQSRLGPSRKRGLERAIRDARVLLEAASVSATVPDGSALGAALRYRRANP